MSKKLEAQLRPCPFCGGRGRLKSKQGRYYSFSSNVARYGAVLTADYYIRCEKCHAITAPHRKEEVCSVWNRGFVFPAMSHKEIAPAITHKGNDIIALSYVKE